VSEVKCILWRDDVTLQRPVSAAAQRHDVRTRFFLRIEHDGAAGFGEIAPQPVALNGDPSTRDVLEELSWVTMPQLLEVVARERAVPSWTRLARFAGSRAASSFSVALVEMALLDREARLRGDLISSLWPHNLDTPVQATVSILDCEEWSVPTDVARVRVKTAPGPLTPRALDRLGELVVPILLDYNCSVSSDEQVFEQVEQISRVATIDAVEQPYPPGNVIDHATLADQLPVPLSLDEGVRSPRDLEQISRYSAARIVCLKPPRVGGLANTRTMAQRAVSLGLTPYIGGFFESSYARHVHRLLANSCISQPSDVANVAVQRDRPCEELERVEGGFDVEPSSELLGGAEVIATWP
jgi:L-alanine-DL-glutamate epimerase-like enolase superfamily enzyme